MTNSMTNTNFLANKCFCGAEHHGLGFDIAAYSIFKYIL